MASDGARKQFWKRGSSKVPGREYRPLLLCSLLKATPKVPTTPVKAKRVSTFQEFESNTSDAWDAGEDDDELLAMAAETQGPGQPRAGPPCRGRPGVVGVRPPGGRLAVGRAPGPHLSSPPAPLLAGSASDAAPLQRSQSLPHAATVVLGGAPEPGALSSSALSEREASRLDKFKHLLAGPNTDLEELRKLSWSGIPKPVRAITWKLLSGYLPANVDRRPATLQRKQKEYFAFIDHYYDSRNDEVHQDTYRQIHIDIPRMSPEALILQPKVTEIFERILFIWAIRHPASGYVQGINDLVTPFFVVFICEYIDDEEADSANISRVPEDALRNVEADTYWCMSRLLDGIQDNYTFAQPGIQMKVKMLEELVSRIDGEPCVSACRLAGSVFPAGLWGPRPDLLRCSVLQSEPEGFANFHLYVCAAFLVRWRKEILEERDFQELLLFLQNLPTAHWGDEDVSLLLAEAYRLKFAFADAPNHYKK
uniref:Rab-GAP TBC domain-containing protein n=1 Tax=Capra hircus TaxID=9925 RepID=A0A8C2NHC7_CAPHI